MDSATPFPSSGQRTCAAPARRRLAAGALCLAAGLALAAVPFPVSGQPQRPKKPQAAPESPALEMVDRIRPGMVLEIRSMNLPPREELDGVYTVEASGKVPLGFMYGRLLVKDLTFEEAEQVLLKHIKTVRPDVKAPKVLVMAPNTVRTHAEPDRPDLHSRLDRLEKELRELRATVEALRGRPREAK